ncbi:MAG: polyprenyl synthetase family protein [Candidatus Thermoplasmatota archaeon]|jgi:octaprenyl-diphosphate synthase|nr:polyprenyl synthetase family protein [Candidatus Thermoplasmatota archaeon]
MKDFLVEWESTLSEKISKINQSLVSAIHTDQKELYQMSRYIIEAGGKRFRPLLTIIAYEIATGGPYEKILDLASSCELIHTASLIHDDIIDNAPTRRGKKTLNSLYGLDNAIVVGDYLFAKAYELGARYGYEVSKIMSDCASMLAEGQILEYMNLGKLDLSEEKYIDIIARKTAYFFSVCTLAATTAAGSPPEVKKSLSDFAYNLGIAFQITDDILDIVGEEAKLGKAVFADIKHNAITLPIIHALKNADSMKERLIEIIKFPTDDPSNRDELKHILTRTGSLDYAFNRAKYYVEESVKALNKSGKSQNINLLMDLAMIIIDRIGDLA